MTGSNSLPTVSDLFKQADSSSGYNDEGVPTVSQMFKEADQRWSGPFSGDFADYFFSHTAPGRVLRAFGQDLTSGWGAEPVDLSEETKAQMVKDGAFNDYLSGRTSIAKSFNEAMIRGVAVPLSQAVTRGVPALTHGLAGMFEQAAKEVKTPEELPWTDYTKETAATVLGGIGDIIESIPYGGVIGDAGPPASILEARAKGHIGEGEEGFYNTKPVSPENLKARQEAAQEIGIPIPQPEPPVTDIHTVARQIDPVLFKEWDDLQQKRADLVEQGRSITDKYVGESELNYSPEDTVKLGELEKAHHEITSRMSELAPEIDSSYKWADEMMPQPEELLKQPAKPETKTEVTGQLEGLPGVGEMATRGVSRDLEIAAIEKDLIKEGELGNLPQYQKGSYRLNAEKAVDLVKENPALAKDIVLGKEPLPSDHSLEALYKAVKNEAISKGDIETIGELAHSPYIAKRVGVAAQTLGQYGFEADKSTDPVAVRQNVEQAREVQRTRPIRKETERLTQSINRVNKQTNWKDAVRDFIKNIECDY